VEAEKQSLPQGLNESIFFVGDIYFSTSVISDLRTSERESVKCINVPEAVPLVNARSDPLRVIPKDQMLNVKTYHKL